MAAFAMVIPILQFRKFWNQRQFWIAVSILTALQVPSVGAAQHVLEHLGPTFLLWFGIADGIFVIVVIWLLCSRSSGEGN
jgi:hypothetical protein